MTSSNGLIAISTLALSIAFTVPGSAHDCPKDSTHKKKEAASMMMKGAGHMDRMHMQTQMKKCMKARMDQDSESAPAKLRQKMMAHMDSCMASMAKPDDAPAAGERDKHEGSKQKSHDHNH